MKNSKKTLEKRNKLKKQWFEKLKNTDFPKKILRVCPDCGKLKECEWQHSFTQTGKPEYRKRCVDCHKKYLSELRKKRRDVLNKQKKSRAKNVKQKCIEFLGGKCSKCGERDPIVLNFHHLNPKDKKIELGILINNGYSFENKRLQQELKKCILLCFNCHMKEHGGNKNV